MSDGMHALNDVLIMQGIREAIERFNRGEKLSKKDQMIIDLVKEHTPHLLQDTSSLCAY